ncbi:MAG: hypothetical protein ACD_2C00274G0001 [uncultured bacterium (gcode 4)]|uniref:Uncharacterized protein n=1 Tax=uncultured bacterium (gcode 4) TaxID=1234023 RepID=K2G3H2_9BACT|nr:MAG: hypothetical protein ACD_2C00274G0001 [uncultured bacterium (gcode 4)]
MKSKIIAIIIILAFFWGFMIYWSLNRNIPASKVEKVSNDDAPVIRSQKMNISGQKRDIAFWSALDDAISSQDITKCNEISDAKLMQNCKDMVNITEAKSTQNKDLCSLISSDKLKNECLNSFLVADAMSSKKKEDCEKIIWDDISKRQCLGEAIIYEITQPWFTGTQEICNRLDWIYKANCIALIADNANKTALESAVLKKDANACNSIADLKTRNNCIESINLSIWMNSTDITSCNIIEDSINKESCIASVKKNLDAATFQKASNSTSTDSCASISDPETKKQCIEWIATKVAISSRDQTACLKITDTALRQKCINTVKLLNSVK